MTTWSIGCSDRERVSIELLSPPVDDVGYDWISARAKVEAGGFHGDTQLTITLTDLVRFRDQMEAFLTGQGRWTEIEAEKEKLVKTYGIDPLEDIFRIMDDEMAWFALEGETSDPDEEVLMIETRSQSETSEVVLNWIEQFLQVHAFDMQSYRHVYRLDNQSTFTIDNHTSSSELFLSLPSWILPGNHEFIFEISADWCIPLNKSVLAKVWMRTEIVLIIGEQEPQQALCA